VALKQIEKPKYNCFKNWNKSATSIEADGVVEGFQKSIEMHNLKYKKLIGTYMFIFIVLLFIIPSLLLQTNFIILLYLLYYLGNGDSSVTKRLNEVLPYGPNFLIQKIECRNHLL